MQVQSSLPIPPLPIPPPSQYRLPPNTAFQVPNRVFKGYNSPSYYRGFGISLDGRWFFASPKNGGIGRDDCSRKMICSGAQFKIQYIQKLCMIFKKVCILIASTDYILKSLHYILKSFKKTLFVTLFANLRKAQIG